MLTETESEPLVTEARTFHEYAAAYAANPGAPAEGLPAEAAPAEALRLIENTLNIGFARRNGELIQHTDDSAVITVAISGGVADIRNVAVAYNAALARIRQAYAAISTEHKGLIVADAEIVSQSASQLQIRIVGTFGYGEPSGVIPIGQTPPRWTFSPGDLWHWKTSGGKFPQPINGGHPGAPVYLAYYAKHNLNFYQYGYPLGLVGVSTYVSGNPTWFLGPVPFVSAPPAIADETTTASNPGAVNCNYGQNHYGAITHVRNNLKVWDGDVNSYPYSQYLREMAMNFYLQQMEAWIPSISTYQNLTLYDFKLEGWELITRTHPPVCLPTNNQNTGHVRAKHYLVAYYGAIVRVPRNLFGAL